MTAGASVRGVPDPDHRVEQFHRLQGDRGGGGQRVHRQVIDDGPGIRAGGPRIGTVGHLTCPGDPAGHRRILPGVPVTAERGRDEVPETLTGNQ
jgi:hypothetical protein